MTGTGLDLDSLFARSVLHNVVTSGGGTGLRSAAWWGGSPPYEQQLTISQAAFSDSSTGLQLGDYPSDSYNKFTANLAVGNNATAMCAVSAQRPGLDDGTCTTTGLEGSSSYTSGYSDAVLRVNRSLLGSFNADLSLKSGDTVLLGKSNDLTTANTTFVAGQTCPALATMTASDFDQSKTWLRNAVELVGDELGNDDGLCESGEACLYTPNLGRYQGHGTLVSCNYIAGSSPVTGVTLYGYTANGM